MIRLGTRACKSTGRHQWNQRRGGLYPEPLYLSPVSCCPGSISARHGCECQMCIPIRIAGESHYCELRRSRQCGLLLGVRACERRASSCSPPLSPQGGVPPAPLISVSKAVAHSFFSLPHHRDIGKHWSQPHRFPVALVLSCISLCACIH
jgi:hypothetical protein